MIVGLSVFLLFVLLFLFIGILGSIFWLWMLIDCAVNEPSQNNDKIVWIILILFLHVLGALLYFFIRRPQRIRESGV